MAYKLMKRVIDNAKKDGSLEEKKDGIMDKLDAFLAADRLNIEEYKELTALIGA